jgi:hypothetical protein
MPRYRLAAAVCAAMIAVAPARADEIAEGLDRAKQLYDQGDLRGASTELNFTLNALVQKRNASYAALFPAAPAGWKLEEAGDDVAGASIASQMLGGGIMVERTYSQASGDGSIKAAIMADGPMVQAMAAMLGNPAMIGPTAKRVRIGGDNAILQREAGSNEAELTMARGNVLVKLSGSGLANPDVLTDLMKRFDLAKLQNPQQK